jgi:ATP-dependent DNA ligase
MPPVEPMLARLVREFPEHPDEYLFEPKWDGFRCLAFRIDDDVDLRSRNQRPFSRYFPEVVEAVRRLPERRLVLDGELVASSFAALLARTHPAATRVARLAVETPATYVAFDVLARGDTDLTRTPFEERRRILESVVDSFSPAVRVTPATAEPDVAARWLGAGDGPFDGVVAKRRDLDYEPGARAMVKIKREHTADCAVGGMRVDGGGRSAASLLLGLYDRVGVLRHVGVAAGFRREVGRQILAELLPLAVPLGLHPWAAGYGERGSVGRLPGAASRWTPDLPLDWIPLWPDRVCEVAYEHADDGRLRHPARFRRWRPDRDAASCRLDQLQEPGSEGPASAVGGRP